MKKACVLPLLLSFVVSGCTATPKKKKTTTSQESSTIDPSSTSSSEPTPTSSQPAPTSSVVPSSSVVPPSSTALIPTSEIPPAGTEITKTIATCLDDFENGTSFTAGGRQIDNHDSSQSNDKIKNAQLLTTYFSSICNVEGMINSITYTALNTNVDRNNGSDVYLTIGTSDAGKIVWQSVTPMKKVILKVNNYHKWFRNYQTETEEQWHTDSAKLIVNGQETSMVVTDISVEPESRFVVYEPAETFTTLTIENELIGGTDHNRIFLESLEITWTY